MLPVPGGSPVEQRGDHPEFRWVKGRIDPTVSAGGYHGFADYGLVRVPIPLMVTSRCRRPMH